MIVCPGRLLCLDNMHGVALIGIETTSVLNFLSIRVICLLSSCMHLALNPNMPQCDVTQQKLDSAAEQRKGKAVKLCDA